MRITVAALGTRGDVQPMIALCRGLKSAGHDVTMIAGSNFAGWVAGHGIKMTPSVDIEALMSSEKGVAWTQGSDNPSKQLRMMRDLMHEHSAELFDPIYDAAETTDLFIASFTAQPLAQTVSEKCGIPYLNALLQPQIPTQSGPASIAGVVPKGNSPLNRWAGDLAERVIWWVAADTTNALRARIGLKKHSGASFLRANHAAPVVMAFSRHVVPPAPDWPAEASTGGYWFLDEDEGWSPPEALAAFLEAGSPPLYIGFGSMSSRSPESTMALILDALRISGGRAVVAAGWGGLPASGDLPEEVYALQSAPHHWLFPRVAGVVHHGGAGTTGAGLRAGKPAMIIPHIADQPYWGRRVHELGTGVKPVPRHALTAERLAAGLVQLASDTRMQDTAGALGEKIRAENGVEAAVAAIEAAVDGSALRR